MQLSPTVTPCLHKLDWHISVNACLLPVLVCVKEITDGQMNGQVCRCCSAFTATQAGHHSLVLQAYCPLLPPPSVTRLITVRSKRNNELSLMSIDIPNHMLAFMLSASQIPVTESMLHPSSSHLFSPSLYLSIFPNTAASRLPVSHSYVTLLFWP